MSEKNTSQNSKNNLTPGSILIGAVGAIVVSAGSFYSTLRFGMLSLPAIMSVFLAIYIFNFFGIKKSGEILLAQTIINSGATVSIGTAFSISVYTILGGNHASLNRNLFLVIMILGSITGIILSFIFKKVMIEKRNMEFPLGKTVYSLVESEAAGKEKIFPLFGIIISFLVSIFKNFNLTRKFTLPSVYTFKNGIISFQTSPFLLGLGYVLGIKNTVIWFLGWVFSNLAVKPALVYYNYGTEILPQMKNNFSIGLVIGVGLCILLKFILFGDKDENIFEFQATNSKALLILLCIINSAAISYFCRINILLSFILTGLCFLCSIATSALTGKTGITPVEIFGIFSLSVILFLNKLLDGININGSMFTANLNMINLFLLVCFITISCGFTGESLNDLKAGLEMKINPSSIFIGKVIGAFISSYVIWLLFFSFFNNNSNLIVEDIRNFSIYQSGIFPISIHNAFFTGIFWLGLGVGFILTFSNISIIIFIMGIYLPFSVTLTVLAGGIISFITSKVFNVFSSKALLFSSGLMAGEALSGIVAAIISYLLIFFKR